MRNHDPPPPARGLVGELVGRVLDYMSEPWRAVVITVLVLLGGFGYGVWVERERLFFSSPPAVASLDYAKIPGELVELLHQTGADLDMVWSVELAKNAQYLIAARTKAGAPWSFTPRRLPAILTDSSPQNLTAALAQGICLDPAKQPGLLAQGLAADGYRRGCLVAIRGPAHVIGVLYTAWRRAPNASLEQAALADMGDSARALVK